MNNNNKSGIYRCRILRVLFVVIALVFLAPPGFGEESSVGIRNADKREQQGARDPFWPVGYAPVVKSTKVVPVVERPVVVGSWSKAIKTIVINGVSSRGDNDFFAVINGEIKSVGDTISVKFGGTVYVWAIDSIKPPKSVKLRRVSAQ